MLITPAYAELNRALHATTAFGVTAPRYIPMIDGVVCALRCETILDYGSGPRKWIETAFGDRFHVQSYDPCVAGLDEKPMPADMVTCIDVFEHIEPECLDAFLDELRRLTIRVGFFTVSTGAAKKILSDGRNAHLIQEGADFWLPKIMARWSLDSFKMLNGEFICVVRA